MTKLARWVTARTPDEIDVERFSALVIEAAAIAHVPRGVRLVRVEGGRPTR